MNTKRGSGGHNKPFCTKAITIIDNFKKALGDTDNRYVSEGFKLLIFVAVALCSAVLLTAFLKPN